MSQIPNFEKEISQFQRDGTYIYELDEVGNVILNPSSNEFNQVYLSVPLSTFVYDSSKIESFYKIDFEEFIPFEKETLENENISFIKEQLDIEKSKNEQLTQQLNSLIENSVSSEDKATNLAIKQVILDLRMSLGQGRIESDFSEDFPYSPILKKLSLNNDTNISSVSTKNLNDLSDTIEKNETSIISTPTNMETVETAFVLPAIIQPKAVNSLNQERTPMVDKWKESRDERRRQNKLKINR